MSATMVERKRKERQEAAEPKRKPREAFHLSVRLQNALERCVNQTRPRTDKTKVINEALEKYLREHGFYSDEEDDAS